MVHAKDRTSIRRNVPTPGDCYLIYRRCHVLGWCFLSRKVKLLMPGNTSLPEWLNLAPTIMIWVSILFLCSLVGSVVIIVGVYTVIWGISEERKIAEAKSISSPLLQDNSKFEDTTLLGPWTMQSSSLLIERLRSNFEINMYKPVVTGGINERTSIQILDFRIKRDIERDQEFAQAGRRHGKIFYIFVIKKKILRF